MSAAAAHTARAQSGRFRTGAAAPGPAHQQASLRRKPADVGPTAGPCAGAITPTSNRSGPAPSRTIKRHRAAGPPASAALPASGGTTSSGVGVGAMAGSPPPCACPSTATAGCRCSGARRLQQRRQRARLHHRFRPGRRRRGPGRPRRRPALDRRDRRDGCHRRPARRTARRHLLTRLGRRRREEVQEPLTQARRALGEPARLLRRLEPDMAVDQPRALRALEEIADDRQRAMRRPAPSSRCAT